MSDEAPSRAHLALDGELDASQQVAFDEELRRSPELAAKYERLRALRRTIREYAPREAAPEALRARIEALAEPTPVPAATPAQAAPLPARPASRWPALAAGVAMAAALAGYWAGRAGGDPDLAALVAGYQRAALSGQPIDVASSDRHTVKPWLAARAPLGALVLDLAEDGFPLVGGRIDIVDGRPVPTLVYRRREHLISVTELPLAQAGGGAATLDGYHVLRWRDRERAYVAISDLDSTELQTFVDKFAQRTPS